MKIYLVIAHPNLTKSRFNSRLRAAIPDSNEIEVCDLYETYPDFYIDVEAEKAKLRAADVIVFQHPFYWYSCPSLLKEWLDSVLEIGFAYGPGGEALTGKYWMQVVSFGGASEAYARGGSNEFTVPELLRPFEQTSRLCGMIYLTPFLVHSNGNGESADLSEVAYRYNRLLTQILEEKIPEIHSTLDRPKPVVN